MRSFTASIVTRVLQEGEPRYATKEWIQELSSVAASSSMTLAAHLCGIRVNEVLDGDDSFVATLYPLGFRRVQINATTVNGADTSNLAGSVPKLVDLMAQYDNLEFIIQKNGETQPLWEGILGLEGGVPSNVTMLVDESKGAGVLAASWPKPPDGCNIGYAGGIGPDNIETVLKDIMIAGEGREVWIDMESSLRTIDTKGKDIFDLNKCFRCIDAVCKAGIYGHPSFLA